MNKFLLKGIIRDKRRSLLPVIVVTIGVFFVVFLDGFIGGMMSNMIKMTANFQTGHLKVTTRAYLQNEEQKPNDLALLDVDVVMDELRQDFPNVDWNERIYFGGLLDIPDENGETKAQGPVSGTAYNLLSSKSKESQRINLQKSIVDGNLIKKQGEIIVSYDFAQNYGVKPGDEVTFFGSTMYGSMTFVNYIVAGIARFGTGMLDKGAVILDISDAQTLLDMDNAASEIYGYLPQEHYNNLQAEKIKTQFNALCADDKDEYAPVMQQLADQNMMKQMLVYVDNMSLIIVLLLMLALSVVLWNTGLLGGIRRYNEFGVRLAMGESKGHIYRSLLTESLFIGIIGSIFGTFFGILLCSYLSKHGIDYGSMMDNLSMMIDPVIRAEVRSRLFYIGFIPGVLSIFIGTALAGRAIYKRKTAMLFKELD
ncbi:MAG: ABC transporter permease [Bacteroidales bacterium]|jgi:putative ABC transport system permease protein|nr:ABC transporter permease [Bacteroidales bacterium]